MVSGLVTSPEDQDRICFEEARPIVSTSVIEGAELTAADRCDRCGAQAYVQAALPGGSTLWFCKHHGRLYADAMKAKGFDLRGSIDFADVEASVSDNREVKQGQILFRIDPRSFQIALQVAQANVSLATQSPALVSSSWDVP